MAHLQIGCLTFLFFLVSIPLLSWEWGSKEYDTPTDVTHDGITKRSPIMYSNLHKNATKFNEKAEKNKWYQWLLTSAKLYKPNRSCVACAGSNPTPEYVVPPPFTYMADFNNFSDSRVMQEYHSMLAIHKCSPRTCAGVGPCTGPKKPFSWPIDSNCDTLPYRPLPRSTCLDYKSSSLYSTIGDACRHCPWPYMPVGTEPPSFDRLPNTPLECVQRTAALGTFVGTLPRELCSTITLIDEVKPFSLIDSETKCSFKWDSWTNCPIVDMRPLKTQDYALADIWWLCDGKTLRATLPSPWSGRCARVMFSTSLFLAPIPDDDFPPSILRARDKRSVIDDIGTEPANTYIDSIGVPRGVPSEHKLVSQVASGFESTLCWWCTINKNVDRINYIHYNVMYQANLTRASLYLLKEELHANTLMTYQNRIGLDFLLAEKNGLCFLFGDQCCTIIPNNTGPLGPLQGLLDKMNNHSMRMQAGSGIDDSFEKWLVATFGQWRSLIISALCTIVIFFVFLAFCCCCCIPLSRKMIEGCLVTAFSREGTVAKQMAMFPSKSETSSPMHITALSDSDLEDDTHIA